MFEIKQWTPKLDLTEFYATAEAKGFTNNSSQKMLVDSLANEQLWAVWILYYYDKAVGSVAAHSFPEMGEDAFRIAARTCVFSDHIPIPSIRTRNQIVTHQHVTSQFLIPTCILWTPPWAKLYITSNENNVGTHRLVHTIFGPAMEATGQMKRIKEMDYRGTRQTVWELFPRRFLEELERNPRW
jgi:hypothetical protein